MTFFRRLLKVEKGQDLLEYGLLVGLIALVAVGAVTTLGQRMNEFYWQSIGAAI